MPYNPGVNDNSGQILGQGIAGMGASLGQGIEKMQERQKKIGVNAKTYDFLYKQHPEMGLADPNTLSPLQKSQATEAFGQAAQVGGELLGARAKMMEAQARQQAAQNQFQELGMKANPYATEIIDPATNKPTGNLRVGGGSQAYARTPRGLVPAGTATNLDLEQAKYINQILYGQDKNSVEPQNRVLALMNYGVPEERANALVEQADKALATQDAKDRAAAEARKNAKKGGAQGTQGTGIFKFTEKGK